jgi:RNA polymerase sigma-70 factor (ECF subfamily)
LIDRIIAGDRDALAVWFGENQQAVYAFVFYRVGGDQELATEATQATFVKALGKLSQFEPERGEMATWLKYLSRNVIRNLLTTKHRGAQWQTAWDRIDDSLRVAYERIDEQPLPDEVLQNKETRDLVAMTLANLPDHYREVLQAKYMNNDSLEAIAQARDSSVEAVKSMLHRSRAAFRECFLTMTKLELSDV